MFLSLSLCIRYHNEYHVLPHPGVAPRPGRVKRPSVPPSPEEEGTGLRATRVAHIGVAVQDLAQALAFYRDVLGATAQSPEKADGATIVSLPFGEVDIELLEPVTPDSPVGRFLARRGPGIHHICFRVPDLDQ